MFSVFAILLWSAGLLLIAGAIYGIVTGDGFRLPAILAVVAIVSGFGVQSSHAANQYEVQSPGQACVLENAREVPTAVTLGTAKDDRIGPIYPCYFLLDQGIQPGINGFFDPVPMKLRGAVNEEIFADQNFTAEGTLGGVMLLGSGIIGGSYDAEQATERKQVVAFMAETIDGYASFIVETGSVRYKECNEDCTPSVLIWTSNQPLFTKTLGEEKDDSIWLTKVDPGVVSLTRDSAPFSPGQTVQALATRIVVELPASLMPGANSLSTD